MSLDRRVQEVKYNGSSREPIAGTKSLSGRNLHSETSVIQHRERKRSPDSTKRRTRDISKHKSSGSSTRRSYDTTRGSTHDSRQMKPSGNRAYRPCPDRREAQFIISSRTLDNSGENHKPEPRPKTPRNDRPHEVDFKCKVCFESFEDITPFLAMDHLQDKHQSTLPRNFKTIDLLTLLVLPEVLMSVSCKICSNDYLSDVQTLKAILREHREKHKDVCISLNDMFQLNCRICCEVQNSLNLLNVMSDHTKTHMDHRKIDKERKDHSELEYKLKDRKPSGECKPLKYNPILIRLETLCSD